MLSLVPLTCFLLMFLVVQNRQAITCWRRSFLSAALLWGLLLTAITEILSLFRLINFWSVLGLWLVGVVGAMICLSRCVDRTNRFNVRAYFSESSRVDRLVLIGLTLIVTTVGMIAWISPPNSSDAMAYHMSRVVHWIQNGSVAHYPTHIFRQLYLSPWAEFAILHFQILSGTDRFANLIEWFSMLGAILGISLLAKQLGAGSRGQMFAAAIGATIPMGILQGSSTQTDYVVAFWLVCFVSYAIRLKASGNPFHALATGAGLGLAVLAKATAYLYAFPFMVWIGLSLLRSRHAKGLQLIILIAITSLVINLGHYTRNHDLYGSPLGPGHDGSTEYQYANDIFTIQSLSSNIIRNIGLHLGTVQEVNAVVERAIYRLHILIGIDPGDIRTTWAGIEFHVGSLRYQGLNETTAGNLLHLVFIAATIPLLMSHLRKKLDTGYYVVCLLGAFILFSLYLKWQPWHSRLHLPLFILWSPLIGLLLAQARNRSMANIVIVTMFVAAIPWVVFNSSRPIVGHKSIVATGRAEQYFATRPLLFEPYLRSTEFVSHSRCRDIGLVLDRDDWEYPFWTFLGEDDRRPVRLEHVNVANVSQVKYREHPFNGFTPCAVIVVSAGSSQDIHVRGVRYVRAWFSHPVSVFTRT